MARCTLAAESACAARVVPPNCDDASKEVTVVVQAMR
jgi:hypothetical protein